MTSHSMTPRRIFATCLSLACPAIRSLTLDFESVPAGNMVFRQHGVCSSGNPAFVGVVMPETLTRPNEFFIEFMGGAVCFNKGSCTDPGLSYWTDIEVLLVQEYGMTKNVFNLLTGGFPLPLINFGALGGGWLPGMFADHPLEGMRGIFVPTCSADVVMGRHDASYDNTSRVWTHHGGMQLREILTALTQAIPDVTKIFVQGGSGGGVAAAAWVAQLADQWPDAQIRALVDSGFHLLPGTSLFRWFYDNVVWSPGPGGQQALKIYDQYTVPSMDWREVHAFEERLKLYNGRARIAYIGCDEDGIVYGDRRKMGRWVTNFNDSQVHQKEELWEYLTTNRKCARPGTVWSWVAQCTSHHLTLRMGYAWSLNITRPEDQHIVIPGEISVKEFVYSYYREEEPDPRQPGKYNFWYDNRTEQMGAVLCPRPIQVRDIQTTSKASVGVGMIAVRIQLLWLALTLAAKF